MTEVGWLACTDPEAMLAYLKKKASNRKFRLLLVALWRRRFGDMPSYRGYQKELAQAEEMAEGRLKPKRGQPEWIGHHHDPHYAAVWSVKLLAGLRSKGRVRPETQADLIRDVFGNPFRPVAVDPAWLTWHDGLVVRLARAAYDERSLPAGTLDNARLAVLADALEEAGCEDAAVLRHLRGPGPHVRGCFMLDLLVGRG